MSDLIERLRDKARLRAAHGLTGWVLAEEALLAQAADEIERLTAENKMLRHTHRWNVSPQVDDSLLVCRHLHEKDEKCDLEHYVPAGRLHDAIRERDELRRQLDPMGEYTSADELIAALRAEKAKDDAMKLDARRYRWLRNEANTARKCDPMVCIYPLDEQDLIDGDRLDVAIDAAMGLTRPADES